MMRRRPSADNSRWKAPPFIPRFASDGTGRGHFPFNLHPETIKARAPIVANGTISLLALLLAGALVLVHVSGCMSDRSIQAHVEVAAVLLAIVGLAGISGRVIRSQRERLRHMANDAPADADTIEQLVREKLAAEAASAAKSRYLASVSHEIRSPLNAIYGYAQLMERGGEVDPGEAARIIRRSAEHLTNLVEGLLDISLIENGVLRISNDVVRFAPFLDQVASMFRHGAGAKGLRFIYDRPERLPEFVRMDEKRLRQVLINLLSNAIKFTPSGSVTFRVQWTGQVAVFEVADTGPGIPAEDRERIFLPFERGAGQQTKRQPGIGLGLAISNALIHIQGGELEVDSIVGSGATFRVRLMMGQVAGAALEADVGAPIIGYEGDRRSILVVDDDVHQLRLMRGLLESLGFDVAVAPNGEAGLALSETGRFDLVVLDISMPGLSGWETARRLRARHGADLRIAMLSANAHERHGPEDGEPVHDQFLTKPVELGAFVDAIGALLSLRWIREDDEEQDDADQAPDDRRLPDAALLHVEKLRELLRIGHVRGIEGEIKALALAAPDSREMIARLYACLDRFDLPALRATLDEYQ
ncbi:MAG TPA: ATP-binding protein [Sphingobium sp.]|uniref:hybrid sensor histidine kinase/response regulator n=1 Tax=Sphingobium sp. TaxID=1912891 RepID=UPI002ED47D31